MLNADSVEIAHTESVRTREAGWLVVAASSVGLFLHFGSLLVNAFGVFLTTLCNQFGWSRGQVSLAFMLATLTAMLWQSNETYSFHFTIPISALAIWHCAGHGSNA